MKLTTQIALRMDNVGSPQDGQTIEGSVKDVILQLTQWLLRVSMNSHLRVTIGRDLPHLTSVTRNASSNGPADLMAELEALMNQAESEESE